jgi:hypothetical protein
MLIESNDAGKIARDTLSEEISELADRLKKQR